MGTQIHTRKMSSEKYELAQDELDTIIERLRGNVQQVEVGHGEAKKRMVQVCSGMLDEAGKSLDEMEGEARTAPLQFRAEMLANVRKYRSSVSSLQTQLNKARIEREVGGRGLERGAHGGGGGGAVVVQDQHRQQVLAGTQILDRTGESLFRAQQVALETDAVGGEIINDLGTQREALERTRTRLIESDLELGRARRVVKKMYLNVFSNKIILIVIILIEIGILCGVIYWKYGRK